MDYISNHSNWALITLILLLIAIGFAIFGFVAKKEFGIMAKKFSLYALIATQMQLILGIISYAQSNKTMIAMQNMGVAMKDSNLRLYAVEHPLMMIIGTIIILIGYIKAKKAVESSDKFKKIALYYTIGLVLILARIPWAHWGQH